LQQSTRLCIARALSLPRPSILSKLSKLSKGLMPKAPFLGYSEKQNLFCFLCSYEDNSFARRAGFGWDKKHRYWVTPFADVAAKVLKRLPPKAAKIIATVKERERRRVLCSHAVAPEGLDGDQFAPSDHSYYPFQIAGIEYMLHQHSILLSDQMGLGKTIQVIGLCNLLWSTGDALSSVLIVCPAKGKSHWYATWDEWSLTEQSIDFVEGRRNEAAFKADVVIINYDLLTSYKKQLYAQKWDLVVLDEAHYIKNPDTQRARALVGHGYGPRAVEGIQARIKIATTGTPIVNRPIELFTALHYLDPIAWPRRFDFGKRYCGGYQGEWGWDFQGSSNAEELQYRLRATLMIRRLKQFVLPDLPPKVRQVIEIQDSGVEKYMKVENQLWGRVLDRLGEIDDSVLNEEQYRQAMRLLRGGDKLLFDQMSIARHETARVKIPFIIEHLHEAIESSGKVVCFCHHKVVVNALMAEFGEGAVKLDGSTSDRVGALARKRFQSEEGIKLFVGNIEAAGTVIDLTAASHVVFAELDWVPGNVTQAEDRCHRIGTVDSVLVQHLVLAGSIDAKMAETIVHKQGVIDNAIDDTDAAEVAVMLS